MSAYKGHIKSASFAALLIRRMLILKLEQEVASFYDEISHTLAIES